jgi:hypothetical protein
VLCRAFSAAEIWPGLTRMPVRATPIERNPILFIIADVVEKNKAKTMAANILQNPKHQVLGHCLFLISRQIVSSFLFDSIAHFTAPVASVLRTNLQQR